MSDGALDHVVDLERELQSPACRADRTRLRQLLADDFVEIGASGRRWDRDGVLDLLTEEDAVDPVEVADLDARALGPGVVQVFWESTRGMRRARRTSIWCERADGWQVVFHQGTPVP